MMNIIKLSRKYLFLAVFLIIGTGILSAIPVDHSLIGNISPGVARQRLIASANTYLGTPYQYAGLDSRGLDCSGFVFVSFRDSLNISVPRTSSALYSWTMSINREELKPGDLVFFITDGRGISHVGIYTGDGMFIHAPSEGNVTGVTYDSLSDSYWARTYAGAGRALPWDDDAEQILAQSISINQNRVQGNTGNTGSRVSNSSNVNPTNLFFGQQSFWSSSRGFFVGFGISPNFGYPVNNSVFRGIGVQAKAGYKGLLFDSFQAAVELRPQWDRYLSTGRIALTLSLGNDTFQFFAGPAYTFGKQITISEKTYERGFALLGELGISSALRPITINNGSISLFMEMAYQSYSGNIGLNVYSDLAASLRLSFGARYLWLLDI